MDDPDLYLCGDVDIGKGADSVESWRDEALLGSFSRLTVPWMFMARIASVRRRALKATNKRALEGMRTVLIMNHLGIFVRL